VVLLGVKGPHVGPYAARGYDSFQTDKCSLLLFRLVLWHFCRMLGCFRVTLSAFGPSEIQSEKPQIGRRWVGDFRSAAIKVERGDYAENNPTKRTRLGP
jgi:hypothetical protein